MKKMKKIMSVLLVVAMMITVMPDNCFAVSIPNTRPETGHVGFYGDATGRVDNIDNNTYYRCIENSKITTTEATEDNYNLYYDEESSTLIFNDFVSSGYLLVPGGINIEFEGNNTLNDSQNSIGVYSEGDITICGEGFLNAKGELFYLDNINGNINIADKVNLNYEETDISTYNGGINIYENANVTVDSISARRQQDDVSADIIIKDNAQVTVNTGKMKANGKIKIGGNANVNAFSRLEAKEINIEDSAQVTAAGLYCEAGNVTIDSTETTTFTGSIQFGLSDSADTYELKIRSDLDVTVKNTSAIAVSGSKLIIGNENKEINVTLNSESQGIYLSKSNAEITNGANVKINSKNGVYYYGSPNSISISNSTVTLNASNRASYVIPTLGYYENGYRVMCGASEEEAEVVDISKTTKYYQNKYVKIEPMPEYTLNLTAPSKTVYTTGEGLDITGAKLELSYEDNVTQDITLTEDMITGFDNTREGTQTLEVTYGDKKAQFDVTVIDLSNTYTTNLNANGITNEDFVITAKEGYLISDSETGEFENTLSVSEGAGTYSFYVKHEESDTILGPVSVDYEIDQDAPVIGNITDGETYYTTQTVTVEDKNLDTVTVNDEPVAGDITLAGNTDATYTITAKDKAGNETTVTVTMKPIASLTEEIKDITEENVNSDNKDAIEQVKEILSGLTTENEAEKEEISKAIENCENLIEKIEDAENAGNTENIDKIENITKDNVVLTDKDDLEQAKEDLEKALEEYGDNYTEEEKQEIQDKIAQIEEALEIIHKVEEVIEKIDTLPTPDNVTAGDEEKAQEAKTALEELSDYEKSLVNEELTEKLDKVIEKIEILKQQTTSAPEETTTTASETTTKELETTTKTSVTTTNAPATAKAVLSASKAVTVKKNKVSLTWNKVKDADGYDVFAAPCTKKISKKNIVKSVKGSKVSATIKKISGKKIKSNGTYKIKVRAYKLVNGKKKYITSTLTYHIAGSKNKKYTNAKKINVSSTKVSLKVNGSKKVTAKVVKQDKKKKLLSRKHGKRIRYISTDKTVAAVSSKGKITAKAKGTCYVYAVALNGVQKKIKVTVK